MFALAYRLLGSAEEADDAVQDAYLRWSGARREDIERPAAWLAKVVTNLCLNRLTSARSRRERYVGPWLPEPVVTEGGALGPLESVEQRDSVSTALLVLLERLTPAERAVYVLREAFAYSHREIAGVLDVSEANCRQLYGRAVRRVAARTSRFTPRPQQQRDLVESFVAAAREGDVTGLEKTLAADVAWWGDGGGKVTAALRPIEGRAKVLRFLHGIAERFLTDVALSVVEVNGWAALVAHRGDELIGVVSFETADGVITEARAVMNPDKLGFVRGQLGGG